MDYIFKKESCVTIILMVPATEIGTGTRQSQSKISKAIKGNDQLCTLCENFTAQATQYIGENKTQTELLETLHQACSEMKPFEEQVILYVMSINNLLVSLSMSR